MASIFSVIGPQSFEIVRDRIGRIIADEMDNQYQITYFDEDLLVSNWIERFIPFDSSELPAINVTMGEGNYDFQTAIETHGTYRYFVDVYVNAKTEGQREEDSGDKLAMYKLQKLIGKIRAIIENPAYITLAFAKPFVMNRRVESIHIENPNQKKFDSENSVMGRLIVTVKVPETVWVQSPITANWFYTTIKLWETDRGYQWVDDNENRIFDKSFDSIFQ